MGTLGTGKTRTAINLLGQIKDQQRECAFVVFDFKGDLAESTSLVDALRPQIVRPPSVPVPLDVLAPSARDDQSLNEAALRFRESFARVAQSRPGGIQLDALRDAARLALGRDGVVRIEHVRDALADVYDTNIPRIYLTVGPGCVSDAGWKRGTSGASAGRRRRSCGGGRWF
jgi:DNA sulfur modification protein DndE